MTHKATSRPQLEVLEDRMTPSATWSVFDAPGHGLVRWNSDNGLSQIGTNDTSSNLAINENGDVAASYGQGTSGTLWRITNNGWQQVGTAAPISLAIADNDWIAASFSFANGGVWRITPGLVWQKISDQNATLKTLTAMQVGVTQDGTVIANYGANGLWRFTNSGGWQELTTANASMISVSNNGWILGNFGSLGLWRISDTQGWQLLTNQIIPTQIGINDNGNVAGDFGTGHGLWRIRDSDGWKQLTSASALRGVGISSNDDQVLGDFNGKGVYYFPNSNDNSFRQITSFDVTNMAVPGSPGTAIILL
jgi:hypothetical protein